jgi:hypothetical protein
MNTHIYFERAADKRAEWVCFRDDYDTNGYVVSEEAVLLSDHPHIDELLNEKENHKTVSKCVCDRIHDYVPEEYRSSLREALDEVEIQLWTPADWEQEQKNLDCTVAFYSAAMNVDLNKPKVWNERKS